MNPQERRAKQLAQLRAKLAKKDAAARAKKQEKAANDRAAAAAQDEFVAAGGLEVARADQEVYEHFPHFKQFAATLRLQPGRMR
jgi:hypothetical protein